MGLSAWCEQELEGVGVCAGGGPGGAARAAVTAMISHGLCVLRGRRESGLIAFEWWQSKKIFQNPMCICAKSLPVPRSLLPLHAVRHDLTAVRRAVVLLVPLEGDPSQLPTNAPQ